MKAPLITALAFLGTLAAQAAFGQGGSVLKGHDTNAPIDVASDRIEVQDRADRAIFSGNVHVRQGDMTLDSARLTVAYANDGGGGMDAAGVQIKRLEASGGVTITQPGTRATGQFAIYDVDRKIVTMIGNVSLTRNDSRVNGGRLVIDLDSGRAVMNGGTAGAPGASESGRVTGRFTVPQTRQQSDRPAPQAR
jgi:lipopolysaccharide export system protein LptA